MGKKEHAYKKSKALRPDRDTVDISLPCPSRQSFSCFNLLGRRVPTGLVGETWDRDSDNREILHHDALLSKLRVVQSCVAPREPGSTGKTYQSVEKDGDTQREAMVSHNLGPDG